MKTIIQALKEITTADQKQKHDKMYKENYWYKAWYDTTCDMANLKNKLEGMSRTIYIFGRLRAATRKFKPRLGRLCSCS